MRKILVILTLTFCSWALSKQKTKDSYPECESANYIKPTASESINIKDLNSQMLVARKVLHSVEKNGSPIYQIETGFDSGQSRLVCATKNSSHSISSSIYLPTLISLNPSSGLKYSIWQFHSNIRQGTVGVWNQKSRISSMVEKEEPKFDGWEKNLLDQGISYKIVNYNRNTVQFHFSRTRDQIYETVLMTFDLVSEL